MMLWWLTAAAVGVYPALLGAQHGGWATAAKRRRGIPQLTPGGAKQLVCRALQAAGVPDGPARPGGPHTSAESGVMLL
jgi:hypothetical protein